MFCRGVPILTWDEIEKSDSKLNYSKLLTFGQSKTF